jgi:hypothetical protein
MGLNKGANEGVIYLSVANGRLVQKHQSANENTTTRVSEKNGKTYHEEFFRDLTGVITGIETRENDFGKQWQITFEDEGQRYMVQLPYSGRYSSSFLKALPNVVHGEPVKFSPWEMDDKNKAGKKVTGVTLYQNDGDGWQKIPAAYTKEDPGGLPEMKKIKVKGKEQWDDSEMMSFLEDVAKTWLLQANKSSAQETEEEAPF